MRTVTFRRLLNPANILRVSFDISKGRVIRFTVQLECEFDGTWVPVVRYDTAHGFAHCDKLHPYEPTQKVTVQLRDYNEALTFAIQDLVDHWGEYHQRYEQWRKQK